MPRSDLVALAEAIEQSGPRIDVEDLEAIVRSSKPTTLGEGEVLLTQGAASNALYIVTAGEVAVSVDADVVLGRFGVGAILGEVSLLDRGPASATVRASTATEVLVLDRAAFDALGERSPRATAALLRLLCATLAHRVRTSSDRFETLAFSKPSPAAPPRRSSFIAVLKSLFGARGEGSS